MTQYARPDSDVDNSGGWTTEPLWEKIEEEPYDDIDYVTSPKSAVDKSFTVSLSDVIDSEVHINHIVRLRAHAKVTGTVKYELLQGEAVIKDSGNVVLSTIFDEYNMTLSEAEGESITDYTALRVRVTAIATQKNQYQYISWIRFEVPDVAGNEYSQFCEEIISLSDGFSIYRIPQTYNKYLTETLTLTDAINIHGILTVGKSITENISLSDEISINSILNISQEDKLFLNDEITISIQAETHSIALSDSLNVSDSLTKTIIFNRYFSETLNLSDEMQIHGILIHNQSFSDTLNLSDIFNITATRILNRSYSNTITFTDDLSIASHTPIELNLNINEILNLTDTINVEKYIEPKKRKSGSMLITGGRFRKTKIGKAFY